MIWFTVSLIKQEQLMVCLHFLVRLNSDLLCVNQLPVCTAGTANRLIESHHLFKFYVLKSIFKFSRLRQSTISRKMSQGGTSVVLCCGCVCFMFWCHVL